jgi:prepilin-type N-terminal cleavage/methylation domain-containing protein
MSRTRAGARGFTLIELMITVAIIGILSSIAIPEFQRLALRARQAERRHVVSTIKRGVEDVYVQRGALPRNLAGACQPSCPPANTRRVANWSAGDWKEILRSVGGSGAPDIEGSVYYSYQFAATAQANARDTLDIWAHGDLDGDGDVSMLWVRYERVDGVFRTYEDVAWQTPVGWLDRGADDGKF